MGRALPPCLDAGEQEIMAQGPPHRTGGANPAAAMLRALLLALLWRGSLAQEPGYSLAVPRSVSVQEGLCVLVLCTFTYPTQYNTEKPPDKLYGHWFKGSADFGRDPPVASSDPSREVSQETRGRFRLSWDSASGNCSLQIDDARRTDGGRYFLRVERGSFKYNYRVSTGYTEPEISVLGLTEKPEIQISPALGLPETLVAGEPVTVTCTAPGRCSGTPPQISWTGPLSDTPRDVSISLVNGTSAHSSELRFTPARGDDGKNLTCTVTYSPAPGPSTSRAVSLQVGYPPGPPNITWTLTRNKNPVLGPVVQGAEGDGLSLETQEGDSLTLICEAGSKPVATLRWIRANESLSPGPGGVGCLELSNLSRGDAGEYRCWAKNPYGSASRALRVHVQVLEEPARLLGLGVACGLGVAVGCCLLGCCVVKLRSRGPAPPSAVAKETVNGAQGEHPADDAGLIYTNISSLPMDGTTLAARQTKGIQDGAAAAQDPSAPGELAEPHYTSINFSKVQHKGGQPPEEPATEYSEIRLK